MKYLFLVLLCAGCFFGAGERYEALDKKYQIYKYFSDHRQIPDRKLPPYIFIILEKTKKKKYDEVEKRFSAGFELFSDQQQLHVEYVKYLYHREKYQLALEKTKSFLEKFPQHAELQILRDGLTSVVSGEESAHKLMEQNLKDFSSMSRKFIRDKIKSARK